MKNQYKEKIWYYPYIKNDVGNRKHMEILVWLKENINKDSWNMDWMKEKHDSFLRYKPENLYVYFKSSELAMAFKLRWL
ncbi:hypothetical protein LCGC14_0694710 [marine sediment metagenome]|uniref:Uncharacterized protein n=1 Tax=marine sediment metagenome TaxID=412755 RepID=A0A0F9T5T4_9ZZZZ